MVCQRWVSCLWERSLSGVRAVCQRRRPEQTPSLRISQFRGGSSTRIKASIVSRENSRERRPRDARRDYFRISPPEALIRREGQSLRPPIFSGTFPVLQGLLARHADQG